jgi:hypothetical protein
MLYSSNLALGVSQLAGHLLHQQTQSSFLASSSPRHQQVFSGAIAGEEEDFCKGSFTRTSFTLF